MQWAEPKLGTTLQEENGSPGGREEAVDGWARSIPLIFEVFSDLKRFFPLFSGVFSAVCI